MKRLLQLASAWVLIAGAAAAAAAPAAETGASRFEARSANLLAIGLVHGDHLSLRLSRLLDNAPVTDAEVTVRVRGAAHPAIAQADGSYALQAKELSLPGAAAFEIQVASAGVRQTLAGTLQIARTTDATPADQNGARQIGWWVLNFAVCIGFLMLLSRRRKAARRHGPDRGGA